MDVSDRSLQAKLTQEAKITSASFLSEVIFTFGGFISALALRNLSAGSFVSIHEFMAREGDDAHEDHRPGPGASRPWR